MTEYQGRAVREDGWWVIDVEGVGVTQARTTAEAMRMAVGLVSAMREIPEAQVSMDLTFELPGRLGEELRTARKVTKEAQRKQREAAEQTRKTIRRLLDQGFSKQDAARILKLSPQRISQLAPTSAPQPRPATKRKVS